MALSKDVGIFSRNSQQVDNGSTNVLEVEIVRSALISQGASDMVLLDWDTSASIRINGDLRVLTITFCSAQAQKFIRDLLHWFAQSFDVHHHITECGIDLARMIRKLLQNHI